MLFCCVKRHLHQGNPSTCLCDWEKEQTNARAKFFVENKNEQSMPFETQSRVRISSSTPKKEASLI